MRVALVEAGPDRNARKTIVKMPLAMITFMAPALAFLGGPKFMSWFESEPEPGLQGRTIALPRGRGTGGSTNVNGQIYMRGQREDFDHWRDLGNVGWGYDDLLPYFRRSSASNSWPIRERGGTSGSAASRSRRRSMHASTARRDRSTSRRCAASTRCSTSISRPRSRPAIL